MTGQHGAAITEDRAPRTGRFSRFLRPGRKAAPEPVSQLLAAPSAAPDGTGTAAVQGQGADGSPLVRDAIGVRPATWGEICEHRAEYEAMGFNVDGMNALAARDLPPAGPVTETLPDPAFTFRGGWDTPEARQEAAAIFGPRPHGVATPGTLAAIQAEAERQIASLDPDDPDATAWHRSELSRRNRPYTDPDPTMIDTGSVRWEPPVSAEESASRMARLTYPPADGTREQYAALARQVSAYTNTRSPKEQPSGWEPVFRTAGPSGPLTAWDLRPPLLALPAGSSVAA